MKKEIQEIKLSEYAKQQNLPYKKVWNLYTEGALPAKTKLTKTGRVMVLQEARASIDNKKVTFGTPTMTENKKSLQESLSSTRRNKAATSEPTDSMFHLENGITPFGGQHNGNSYGLSLKSIHEAIKLSQKAYWNFSIVKNVIDTMEEFSTNKIFFRGGNAKSRKFFQNLWDSLNLLDLQGKFFREFYRSGNVFINRFNVKINDSDLKELMTAFEIKEIKAKSKVELPSKYIILNPADITPHGNISFTNPMFYKVLNTYETTRLKNPQTEEEKNFLESLPNDVQKQIKDGNTNVQIPLKPENIFAIFFKKQDYEPLSVPMIYPVLKDINWKAEQKSIDMAVTRTMQQVILLVKMGYENKNGDYMYDQEAANAMRALFESESVGKVLVGDFTTKLEWAIPSIGDFLDPKKYQIVNEDIRTGLNYILSGGSDSKFSNQYIQTQIFIQKLQQGREAFLTHFLNPEIKRISEEMNFKSYPKAFFTEFNLDNPADFQRIVTQLATIGYLTPEEVFESFDSGKLPNGEESQDSQENFKDLKNKGLYVPIVGGPFTQNQQLDKQSKNALTLQQNQFDNDNQQAQKQRTHDKNNPPPAPPPAIHINSPSLPKVNGNPGGKTGKQSGGPRKSSPIKASEELYSLEKIKDNIILAMELKKDIQNILLEKHKIKELNEEQKQVADSIREVIMSNLTISEWKDENKLKEFIDKPVNSNSERLAEIDDIIFNNDKVSPFLASVLIESKRE